MAKWQQVGIEGSYKYSPKAIKNLNLSSSFMLSQDTDNQPHAVEISGEYKTSNAYTGGHTISGRYVSAHQLVSAAFVTNVIPPLLLPPFIAGVELSHSFPANKSVTGLTLKYRDTTKTESIVLAVYPETAVLAQYLRKVSSSVSVASQLVFNMQDHDTIAQLGLQYLHPKFGTKFNAVGDTNLRVMSSLELPVAASLRLALCASLDHWDPNYHFGIGLMFN